jgi:hypothetical protein
MKKLLPVLLALLYFVPAVAQLDLRVTHVLPSPYLRPGTYTFIPGVENRGTSGGNIRIWWQVDKGPVKSTLPKMPSGVLSGQSTGKFESDSFLFTVTTPGISRLKVWTTIETPGRTETNPQNDTLFQTIKVMDNLPQKNVILEVYKHQRCGPCYPAAEYNHKTIDPLSNYSTVNLYTDPTDALYNADAQAINGVYHFAHPAPMFDRFRFPYLSDITPGYVQMNNVYFLQELGRRDLQFSPVQVSVASMSLDTGSRLLKVRLRATTLDTMSGDFRFNLWITEDSLKGMQAGAPDENNYWHNHVLRSFVGGQWGKQSSLPAKLNPGQTYTCDFQYTIPASYKLRHLRAIGLVQAYSSDIMARPILNSVEVKATQKLTVLQNKLESEVSITPNPAQEQLQIRIDPAMSLEAMRFRIRATTGQLIREQPVTAHQQSIPLKDLPSGTYIWSIQSPEGELSKPFVKID